ncbi:carboxypeptidase-like regulatory domain-containing protein [Hymenobacter sp. IS2118]|uniref:carboxypeptidase-like regulatory domain-containing protein n=1 Tax=Hymenobacter sp. IS2118 TaxID=1505605 RepID=UPI0005576CA5
MSHLSAFLTLLALLLFLGTARAQPTRTLTGRILSDRLEEVPGATIFARDTTIIGTTDMAGYFKIEVPVNTNTLIFASIGMEWTTVKLSGECSDLEVMLPLRPRSCFMSVRRVNRQSFKRFKHLPQLHREAYEKGLFKSHTPCAAPLFTKWIPRSVKRLN